MSLLGRIRDKLLGPLSRDQIHGMTELLYAAIVEHVPEEVRRQETAQSRRLARTSGRVGYQPPVMEESLLVNTARVATSTVCAALGAAYRSGRIANPRTMSPLDLLRSLARRGGIPIRYYSFQFGTPAMDRPPDLLITEQMLNAGPGEHCRALARDIRAAFGQGRASRSSR